MLVGLALLGTPDSSAVKTITLKTQLKQQAETLKRVEKKQAEIIKMLELKAAKKKTEKDQAKVEEK